MKYLMYLILFLFSLNSWAQYESVFGDSATSWNLLVIYPDNTVTDSLYVVRDSIINSETYKIVKSKTSFGGGTRYLKETEDHSKVYYYYPALSDSIFIVLDLTLEEADTFYINTASDGKIPIVVDSVYTNNSRKHIRFDYVIDYRYAIEKLEFIEGIGSNFGLFYQGTSAYEIGRSHYLLCSHKNGSLKYLNDSKDLEINSNCNIYWTKIEKQKNKSKISVYPNPAQKMVSFKVESDNLNNFSVKIYNICGIVCKTIFSAHGAAELDISHLPDGIYFYTINTNNEVINGKLIKQ